VLRGDYIYDRQDFDSSPIVLESHKLIFFPVTGAGDVTWRCLFRRMMGYSDWQNTSLQFEGLRYLFDYNESEATTMLLSPDYTRAIFVRDPKQRLLYNFIQKVFSDKGDYIGRACCARKQSCVDDALQFPTFLDLIMFCDQPYWRPQGRKMEPRYYSYLNFVGHFESAEQDAQRLLQRIGEWDGYGRTGWGPYTEKAVFYDARVMTKGIMQKYYTPNVERRVENFYDTDYANPYLNLTRTAITNTSNASLVS
jgi:hypothetical protein